MLVVRYFLFVGGALLALLFIADACFPKLPAAEDASTVAGGAVADLSVIRIHSDRKWPERVEFDTSRPTIIPAPVRTAEVIAPATTVTDTNAPVHSRDAFAQLQTPKKPEPKLPPNAGPRGAMFGRPCWSRSNHASAFSPTLPGGDRILASRLTGKNELSRCAVRDFSTAAAYALELGVQQLFTFIRRGLDVAVVTVVMAAGEFSSATAKSVTAARIGRSVRMRR